MPEHDTQFIDSKTRASKLLARYGGYNPAAVKLGNSNLRATLWRYLNEDGFRPSKHFLAALRDWEGVDPVLITAESGSVLFGEVGLLDLGQVVAILIMSPAEWQRHSITCAACGERTPRWSSSQKYCPAHSWVTKEGRRWHRQQKKEKEER